MDPTLIENHDDISNQNTDVDVFHMNSSFERKYHFKQKSFNPNKRALNPY